MNNKHLIKAKIEKAISHLFVVRGARIVANKEDVVKEVESLILSEKKDLLNKFSEIVGESKPKTYIVDGKKYYHSFGGKMALDQYEKELRAKLSQLTEEEKK